MENRRFVKTFILLAVWMLIASTAVWAAGPRSQPSPGKSGVCSNFVDADKDGICDNCSQAGYRHMAGNRRTGSACENFVDANQDDICDNCSQAGYRHRDNSTETGPGCGNFIDENQDGICDYCDQSNGTHGGICDGTGPKGPVRRRP